jgi:hypothetical protein
MPKYTIYLMGQVSYNEETYNWRKRVREHYADSPFVEVIDPTNNNFNANVLESGKIKKNKNNAITCYSDLPCIPLLPGKDRFYVANSNVLFVDMNHYTPEKPLIGTMFELAWAYDQPGKMIIGIYNGDPEKNITTWHPFIRATIQTWVKNGDQACDLLDKLMDVSSEKEDIKNKKRNERVERQNG